MDESETDAGGPHWGVLFRGQGKQRCEPSVQNGPTCDGTKNDDMDMLSTARARMSVSRVACLRRDEDASRRGLGQTAVQITSMHGDASDIVDDDYYYDDDESTDGCVGFEAKHKRISKKCVFYSI
jgi:hypothetical protein